ncbi:MAG: hypothetical protein E7368_05415 [Clostridiales bacterium]|nr:hypothetical protein [Clostridiales bacterium]
MKRKITSIFTLLLAVVFSAFFLLSCDKKEGNEGVSVQAHVVERSETLLVIQVDKTEGEATLYDVMYYLKEEGKITFESQSSKYGQSIVSINRVKGGVMDNPCWLAYTSDTDEANASLAWGGYEYQGQMLGSCNFGMSSMPVKAGCLYVWALVQF